MVDGCQIVFPSTGCTINEYFISPVFANEKFTIKQLIQEENNSFLCCVETVLEQQLQVVRFFDVSCSEPSGSSVDRFATMKSAFSDIERAKKLFTPATIVQTKDWKPAICIVFAPIGIPPPPVFGNQSTVLTNIASDLEQLPLIDLHRTFYGEPGLHLADRPIRLYGASFLVSFQSTQQVSYYDVLSHNICCMTYDTFEAMWSLFTYQSLGPFLSDKIDHFVFELSPFLTKPVFGVAFSTNPGCMWEDVVLLYPQCHITEIKKL